MGRSAGIEASLGEAKPPEATHAGAIDWKVGRLDAKSHERLTIRIIPRQSRPFDLAVRWESKPVASQAMIEVQEPKLSLQLEGPHEVLYGKKELYRLKLSNTGSGNAENVTIVMTPIGAGENVPASHKVGLLAGRRGEVARRRAYRAAGRTSDDSGRSPRRRRPARRVGRKGIGPPRGIEARHRRAESRNSSAPWPPTSFASAIREPRRLENVNFSVALPAGAKYLSGIDGARLNAAENKLAWSLETLAPDVEQTFHDQVPPGHASARADRAA